MVDKIKDVLMERDGMSEEEALKEIDKAKRRLNNYLNNGDIEAAGEVCSECFGLEPDYLMELF